MSFEFTRRKPIKERHIEHIPDTLAKIVHGLIAEWKVDQVIAENDGTKGTLMPVCYGIEIPYFFCMGQRLIKVVYQRRNNVKMSKRFKFFSVSEKSGLITGLVYTRMG